MGSKEPIRNYFLLPVVKYHKTDIIPLVSIQNEPKSLQSEKIKDFGKWGDPWGVSDGPKVTFRTTPPIFVTPAKNQQA